MPVRRIRLLGDPVLRQVSAASTGDPSPVLADLRDTLHEFQRTHGFGRGISAVQIGEPVRIIYMEAESQVFPLVNPRFVRLSDETFDMWDDCFSFPNLMVKLKRSRECVIEYEDESGTARQLQESGRLSELIQHEMDHLDGILAIDRAIDGNSLILREEWIRQGLPVVIE